MPKVTKAKSDRVRDYVFTVHNWTQSDLDQLAEVAKKCTYMIYGKEICPKTGGPHLQGYLYLKYQTVSKTVKKLLSPNWTEAAEGTAEQNRVYCSKDGDYTVYGVQPKKGRRTDLESFVDTCISAPEKLHRRELIENFPKVLARYPMFVDLVQREYHAPTSLDKLDNLWIHGPPGTGKTFYAMSLGPHYMKGANKWFCGYGGQPNIIIEEVGPEDARQLKWGLKVWGDKHPFTAQTKGSSMFIRPARLLITANYSIAEMGYDQVTTDALLRRYTEVPMFTKYIE